MEGQNFSGYRGPPKPVEIGKEYDVEIKEISRRGEGIARIEGLVVFVPNTKNGDQVKIRVTRLSSRFAEAEVVAKKEMKAKKKKKTNSKPALGQKRTVSARFQVFHEL
jgi:predicted RNA-binding protein with TRAM domain